MRRIINNIKRSTTLSVGVGAQQTTVSAAIAGASGSNVIEQTGIGGVANVASSVIGGAEHLNNRSVSSTRRNRQRSSYVTRVTSRSLLFLIIINSNLSYRRIIARYIARSTSTTQHVINVTRRNNNALTCSCNDNALIADGGSWQRARNAYLKRGVTYFALASWRITAAPQPHRRHHGILVALYLSRSSPYRAYRVARVACYHGKTLNNAYN